jgi:hypothetical protein
MLGSTLIRDESVQVCQPRKKRLLASSWMLEPLHGAQLSVGGVVGLLSVLVTSICGSVSTAHHPALFAWNQRWTRSPLATPAL